MTTQAITSIAARRSMRRPSLQIILLLLILTIATIAVLITGVPVMAQEPSPSLSNDSAQTADNPSLTIYLFWGDGCPHCTREKEFLKDVLARYPQVDLREFEVWKNKENAAYFKDFTRRMGIERPSVPLTIIGNSGHIGFSEEDGPRLEALIRKELKLPPLATQVVDENAITIPLLGTFRAEDFSLPVFTLVLGALDSFNPCALYVLLFLLSFLVHARSRTRMLLVGGTFVFFSGFIYFLFMAAWLNLFFLTGRVAMVTTVAGVIALIAGAINVKDFFAFKKGVTLSMSDETRGKLTARMRTLLRAPSLWSLLAGTAVLAILANAYELLCTAGFPMVFTRVLTLHELPPSTYYFYLVMYNVVYVIPLALVVAVFVYTLGSRKLTEYQGRTLKLLSGAMMLSLGGVLLLRPELLNNPLAAAGLLAGAVAVTALLSLLLRKR